MMRDVVIVGGGPTGLMLACELRLSDVAVTVLERLAEPSGFSKPLSLSGRTIDTLGRHGLLERFSAQAQSFGSELVPVGRKDLPKLSSNQSALLIVQQARIEELLEERAIELGATLRWGHELIGLEQECDGLRLEVRDPNGDYQLRTRLLVGCDGEQRVVRDLCRLARFAEVEPNQTRRVILACESEFDTCLPAVVSLAWKLAAEIGGWAPSGHVLDTYHAERAAGAACSNC